MLYQVIWDIKAKQSLKDIFLYLKEESPSAANKVRNELLKLTSSLEKMPERFSSEYYLRDKGNEYHSVTKWSFKIVYRIKDKEVRILDIIHTRRNTAVIEGIK